MPSRKLDPLGAFLAKARKQQDLLNRPDNDPARLVEPENMAPVIRPVPWFDPVEKTSEVVHSLAAARGFMEIKVREYLDIPIPDYTQVIVAPPGVGKTRTGVRTADRLAIAGKQVAYLGPRHDHFETVLNESLDPSMWHEWLPRQLGDADKGKIETCKYEPYMSIYQERKFKSMDFCTAICGFDYIANGCPWHGQKYEIHSRRLRIVFAQHQHLYHGLPIPSDVVIGDELPLNAAINIWIIPANVIAPFDKAKQEPFDNILRRLQEFCQNKLRITGRALVDALGGAQKILDSLNAVYVPPNGFISIPDDVMQLEYNHAPRVMALLRQEAEFMIAHPDEDYEPRIETGEAGLTMYLRNSIDWRSPTSRQGWPPHMIWLDGTGNEAFYQMMFDRNVKVVAPIVEGAMFITQFNQRANGKTTLTDLEPGVAKRIPSAETNHNRRRQLVIMAQEITRQAERAGGKAAAITFKDVEEAMAEVVSRDEKNEPLIGHYYAERGSNRFKDVDDIIVAGKPQAGIEEMRNIVRCLRQGRMDPIMKNGKIPWNERAMPYVYVDPETGRSPGVYVNGPWGDPDLEAVHQQLTEAEIIQAVKRGRDVLRNADKPLRVWLLTNYPIESLPPNRLISYHELFVDLIPGIDAMMWPMLREFLEVAYKVDMTISVDVLVENLGIGESTARKYMSSINGAMARGGPLHAHATSFWRKAPRPRRALGRPATILTPDYGFDGHLYEESEYTTDFDIDDLPL